MGRPIDELYDEKCYELAEHFLQDEPVRNDPAMYKSYCHMLAIEIQKAVEGWFDTPDGYAPSTGKREHG